MRTSRENINYAPVNQYSNGPPNMDPVETSKPEAEGLLNETKTPQIWSNGMSSKEHINGAGKLPVAQNENAGQIEPKINWKQIAGCLSANSLNIGVGSALTISSALIPALQKEDSEIKVTLSESAWIASITPLSAPIGALFGAFLMERIGRLRTLQISTIPLFLSWILLALAPNFALLLTARFIMGIILGYAPSAATVLITETALKNYRGPLTGCSLMFSSVGMLLGYVVGALVPWRTAAWICMVIPLLTLCLITLFTAESPLWLRSRGRTEAARRSCMYYYGVPDYFVQPAAPPVPPKANGDIEKKDPKSSTGSPAPDPIYKQVWLLLSHRSGFKPLLILSLIFVLQNLSGIYITMFYAVSFFETAGSPMDPHIASVLIGVVRLITCVATIFLLGAFGRRQLMIISALGMAIFMGACGYTTNLFLIEKAGGAPSPLPSWFLIVCVVTYILFAAFGLMTIPWTMTAELFPQRVRGAAQAFMFAFVNIFMFAVLQSYPLMFYYLGGAVGVQYAFAVASFLAALLCWIFQPETHGKTLDEIEEYFAHNTIFIGRKK